MQKIIDYKLVDEWDSKILNETVSSLMKDGWVPFHGAAVSTCAVDFYQHLRFTQAMVRYAEDGE